jgi:hypothetical protein
MPKDAQFHWLEDIRQIDLQGERIVDEELRRKYTPKFQRFLKLPDAEQVIALTAEYVRLCVPCPKRSELLYWNVSCLPQPDLFLRLNVGWQETFVVQRDSAGDLVAIHWYFGTDGVEEFATHPQAGRWERFWNSVVPYYDIVETSHKAAGPPQSRLSVYSLDDARKVLSDANAVLAMRQTNLGLAQKRASGYQRNHCLDLADAIFVRIDG